MMIITPEVTACINAEMATAANDDLAAVLREAIGALTDYDMSPLPHRLPPERAEMLARYKAAFTVAANRLESKPAVALAAVTPDSDTAVNCRANAAALTDHNLTEFLYQVAGEINLPTDLPDTLAMRQAVITESADRLARIESAGFDSRKDFAAKVASGPAAE